jgi:hypothetical protein
MLATLHVETQPPVIGSVYLCSQPISQLQDLSTADPSKHNSVCPVTHVLPCCTGFCTLQHNVRYLEVLLAAKTCMRTQEHTAVVACWHGIRIASGGFGPTGFARTAAVGDQRSC